MPSEHTPKTVTITVNTTDHVVPHMKIGYVQIVDFEYGEGASQGAAYIVKYSRGASENVSGILPTDGEVMVKDGMLFRVSPTGES